MLLPVSIVCFQHTFCYKKQPCADGAFLRIIAIIAFIAIQEHISGEILRFLMVLYAADEKAKHIEIIPFIYLLKRYSVRFALLNGYTG